MYHHVKNNRIAIN